MFQRALTIREQQLGPEHPDTATSLNNLALLYDTQGKYEQAEPLYQRALAIREAALGYEHPATATSLYNLAELYRNQGKYEQAKPLFQRALDLYEKALGTQHPHTQQARKSYASLLQVTAKTTSDLHLRLTEEPLTLHNLSTAFYALTKLSTKCWLIAKGRFADLTEYTQTHNRQFDEESGLIISSITYNSPINIKLKFSLESVAKAVKIIINTIIDTKARKEKLELENKRLILEIKEKEQEIAVKTANGRIENQKTLIELYDQQLELKRKQIDLLDYASEKVPKIVEMLNPNAGIEDRKIASNSLVKSILGLGEANGLELVLFVPQESNEEEIDETEDE